MNGGKQKELLNLIVNADCSLEGQFGNMNTRYIDPLTQQPPLMKLHLQTCALCVQDGYYSILSRLKREIHVEVHPQGQGGHLQCHWQQLGKLTCCCGQVSTS